MLLSQTSLPRFGRLETTLWEMLHSEQTHQRHDEPVLSLYVSVEKREGN